MTISRIETLDHVAEGLAALGVLDPRLVPMIERAGAVPLRRQPPGYEGLAAIIVSQMVSKASAEAIWQRLVATLGTVTPHAVLRLDEEAFRAVGLSRAKQRTLQIAARACAEGLIDLDRLCTVQSDEAIAAMTAIKGIGPWTAEVYLLFCAGHPDVFPAGDVALQSAAAHGLALEARPDARTLRMMAEAWQPWRGVAARLLWSYYALAMGRAAVPVQP